MPLHDPFERVFEHDGRSLTIQAKLADEGWSIQVLENDKPVTNVTYEIKYEVAMDSLPNMDWVGELMNIAESDIERGWVKLHPV